MDNKNPFAFYMGLAVLAMAFIAMYFVAKSIFWVLSIAAPVLFILALLLDYKVVISYGKWLINLVKRNPLMGIVSILLTVVGYPVVAGFLFFKALGKFFIKSKMKEINKKDYAEYEEVEDEDFLNLPELDKQVESKDGYEELFD